MFSTTLSFTVPDLPDNGVAFANNAAWVEYWAGVSMDVQFEGVDNTIYAESLFSSALPFYAFNIAGVNYEVPSKDQFNSLLAAYIELNTSYKVLREELKQAGILQESQ